MIKTLAKRFAKNGYFVFPTYKSRSSNVAKPYGWTGNVVREDGKQELAIPASQHELDIDTWDEQLKTKYRSVLTGYGILGKHIVIFDIDVKDGKDGAGNFQILREKFGIPTSGMIVKSRGGGFHLFFAKPAKYKDKHVKSVANIIISGNQYVGVDIRGDGGYVQGATSSGEWVEGNYTIIGGGPEAELSVLPEEIMQYLVATHMGSDIDTMMSNNTKSDDISSILRRGELPESIPDGSRNESFFIYLNALKNRGIGRDIAKQMASLLVEKCENVATLHESVNIEDMLDRIFEKTTENPYDIAVDLVNKGLYQLMNYKSKVTYIMTAENPYILSKNPHDLSSMRELLVQYTRGVTGSDGKTRQINPIDVAIRRIPDNQKADTIGFKPGAPRLFTLNDDLTGKRYLNMYQPPEILQSDSGLDMDAYNVDFKALITRIFGSVGTNEHQLGLDFCAWFIQNPGLKVVITPYLLSKNRGVGKSLFLNLLTRIYGMSRTGERQAKIIKLDDISSRFFDPTGVLINIIDEVQFAVHRNMRQETSLFWRHLKNLVTADTVPVEIKNGGVYQVPNTAGLIMAGNKGGHFPIEELDRRVWIIDNEPPILERGTIDKLFDIVLKSGNDKGSMDRQRGIDAIRYGLSKHKIEIALDSVRAPNSDTKIEMMKNSMTDIEEWIFDYFSNVDNLISETPIITRSMFVYMMQVSDVVYDERWRDEAEIIFRDFKRKGVFQAIKYNNASTTFINIPIVTRNGEIVMTDRKESLYTTRDHGQFDMRQQDSIRQMFFRNLHTISKWKRESVTRSKKQAVNIEDEMEKFMRSAE